MKIVEMNPPHYWLYETGGELRPAVEAFLKGRRLTARQVYLIREYIRQWMMSPVWDANPSMDAKGAEALASLRKEIDRLTTAWHIQAWLRRALLQGHDPL